MFWNHLWNLCTATTVGSATPTIRSSIATATIYATAIYFPIAATICTTKHTTFVTTISCFTVAITTIATAISTRTPNPAASSTKFATWQL